MFTRLAESCKRVWTKDRPQRDGYYWFRGGVKDYPGAPPLIAQVEGGVVYLPGSEAIYELDEFEGEWQPLEIPR
jgi:hypothetical protein